MLAVPGSPFSKEPAVKDRTSAPERKSTPREMNGETAAPSGTKASPLVNDSTPRTVNAVCEGSSSNLQATAPSAACTVAISPTEFFPQVRSSARKAVIAVSMRWPTARLSRSRAQTNRTRAPSAARRAASCTSASVRPVCGAPTRHFTCTLLLGMSIMSVAPFEGRGKAAQEKACYGERNTRAALRIGAPPAAPILKVARWRGVRGTTGQ